MKWRTGSPVARSRLEKRLARSGVIFLLPVMVGLVLFFIIPVVKSFWFSVSNVTITGEGYRTTFQGFSSYYTALFSHSTYNQTVVSALIDMLVQTPLIMIFSFFMASVLNQKFRGRTIFRVILFLPVIVLSAAMTRAEAGDTLLAGMDGFNAYKDTFSSGAVSFTEQIVQMLKDLGANDELTKNVTAAINRIYGVIELSSIQILILLTGMQSISPSLYEAAKVEGGSSWENFWKITFPMVSPLILTCVVYTIVDSFTASNNGVMKMIDTTAFSNQNLNISKL